MYVSDVCMCVIYVCLLCICVCDVCLWCFLWWMCVCDVRMFVMLILCNWTVFSDVEVQLNPVYHTNLSTRLVQNTNNSNNANTSSERVRFALPGEGFKGTLAFGIHFMSHHKATQSHLRLPLSSVREEKIILDFLRFCST